MNPLPKRNPRIAISYRRVSSAEQGKAYGPAAQARAIRDYADREGFTIAADFDEDVSGTLPLDERPGLSAALLAAYRHGASALIVARRDRLARDVFAAKDAVRAFGVAGVRVLYADGGNGGSDGDLLLDDISHAIAAHERRAIVARLRAGREAKCARHPGSRAQGGRVPYGYRRTRTGLEVDPTGAERVREIFRLVREGRSTRSVAEKLTAATGRKWQSATVAGIVRREIYKRREPARIIDPRIWNAANASLDRRRKR